MPVVDGLPGAVLGRQVPPGTSRPGPMQHPIDHHAMVRPRPPVQSVARQQRRQSGPLLVGQIVTNHPIVSHAQHQNSDRSQRFAGHALGLLTALTTATALRAVPGIRENLDVIPGGARLTDLTPLIVSRFAAGGRAAFLALAQALAPIAGDYDLILIDSPPENTTLADLALGAARWVIMPTRSDSGGLVGMKLVAERFQLAREINPNLKLMGVALFASGTGSTAIRAEVRQDVEEAFGGHSPMFEASVRYSERTARDCRKRGLLAHELEVAAAQQPTWWQALRDGSPASRLSRAVSSVSADYQQMTAEALQLLAGAELAATGEGG